jgi:putative ABC transport system permease protein
VAPAAREVVRAVDRDLAVSEVTRFDDRLKIFFRTNTLIVGMFTGFAAIGFIVALTGIYGVTAFSVGQRRHEIGVRMALGATSGAVIRLILRRTVRLMAIGTIVGLATGWVVARMMRGFLFETSPLDPLTYVTVIGLLALSGLAASYVPAHRAVSIDPVAVLKRE